MVPSMTQYQRLTKIVQREGIRVLCSAILPLSFPQTFPLDPNDGACLPRSIAAANIDGSDSRVTHGAEEVECHTGISVEDLLFCMVPEIECEVLHLEIRIEALEIPSDSLHVRGDTLLVPFGVESLRTPEVVAGQVNAQLIKVA